ncbi:MAG: gliding motility protein [Sphingobacteriaceae bacterium]|nr:gliding motility protein [Sphingobacteriaceae bacterium]
MKSILNSLPKLLLVFCVSAFYACNTQKDNFINRRMQNLTARYNYIYNSNLILSTYQEELSEISQENFEDFISVYPVPKDNEEDNSAGLSVVLSKAQAIIADKSLSNYVDDAYMLMGKVNFYQKNYFTAEAYFEYVAQNYKDNPDTYFVALIWKARAMMQLGEDKLAQNTLSTVEEMVKLDLDEKELAFATLAQMAIKQKDYENAILHLKAAINASSNIESRTRWPYILGQLYEVEKEYIKSLSAYNKAENSNASFDIYFNAKLGKVRVNDLMKENNTNRRKSLVKLLKDDKNEEFLDQIYYQIGENYAEDKDFKNAMAQYKTSIQKSTKNTYQKGKSYLRMADVNFKNLGKYVEAKLYYDSALSVLPKTYPNYEGIVKKSKNLEYLSKRYRIISKEDTAQYVANLPEKDRYAHIQKMFSKTTEKKTEEKKTVTVKKVLEGNFYFNNEAALTSGFLEFKKKWSNRALEDNWRYSTRKAQKVIGAERQTVDQKAPTAKESNNEVKNYIDSLPLTAIKMEESNKRILTAYYEVARFYQHELNDKDEALKIYELILDRFSVNPHLDAIYYSMYLLYNKANNRTKAERYKTLILEYYPNSIYVKAILNPNFSEKIDSMESTVNKDYNAVFALYEKNQFPSVIAKVDESLKNYPDNHLQPQYEYLKAISVGHTQHVDSLINRFNAIVVKHPKDSLITPLVKNHLEFLKNNFSEYQSRAIALPDYGPIKLYTPKKTVVKKAPKATDSIPEIKKDSINTNAIVKDSLVLRNQIVSLSKSLEPKPFKIEKNILSVKEIGESRIDAEVKTEIVAQAQTPVEIEIEDDKTFSKSPASYYYFVVNVADATLTLSSSRYGLGQFNGGNFAEDDLKHKILELENDQLLFVGVLKDLATAKKYEKLILPQLNRIMKVPSNIYTSFVISKENFEKITDRNTLKKYQLFYKKNYPNE